MWTLTATGEGGIQISARSSLTLDIPAPESSEGSLGRDVSGTSVGQDPTGHLPSPFIDYSACYNEKILPIA